MLVVLVVVEIDQYYHGYHQKQQHHCYFIYLWIQAAIWVLLYWSISIWEVSSDWCRLWSTNPASLALHQTWFSPHYHLLRSYIKLPQSSRIPISAGNSAVLLTTSTRLPNLPPPNSSPHAANRSPSLSPFPENKISLILIQSEIKLMLSCEWRINGMIPHLGECIAHIGRYTMLEGWWCMNEWRHCAKIGSRVYQIKCPRLWEGRTGTWGGEAAAYPGRPTRAYPVTGRSYSGSAVVAFASITTFPVGGV